MLLVPCCLLLSTRTKISWVLHRVKIFLQRPVGWIIPVTLRLYRSWTRLQVMDTIHKMSSVPPQATVNTVSKQSIKDKVVAQVNPQLGILPALLLQIQTQGAVMEFTLPTTILLEEKALTMDFRLPRSSRSTEHLNLASQNSTSVRQSKWPKPVVLYLANRRKSIELDSGWVWGMENRRS